jgi:hypothetical protein
MPIDYKHLKGGDEFDSESLNSRFTEIVGVNKGVNSISIGDLSPGAIRGSQLPSLIAGSGTVAEDAKFTKNVYIPFVDPHYITGIEWEPLAGYAITYGANNRYSLGNDTENPSHVHALIILANVDVHRFIPFGDEPEVDATLERNLKEDYYVFHVRIEVELEDGTVIPIYRSTRSVSPRVTINKEVSALEYQDGRRMQNPNVDRYTNQDIPLRTVLLASDVYDSTSEIRLIRLTGYIESPSSGTKVFYDKGNLTAIPIHAKVL